MNKTHKNQAETVGHQAQVSWEERIEAALAQEKRERDGRRESLQR